MPCTASSSSQACDDGTERGRIAHDQSKSGAKRSTTSRKSGNNKIGLRCVVEYLCFLVWTIEKVQVAGGTEISTRLLKVGVVMSANSWLSVPGDVMPSSVVCVAFKWKTRLTEYIIGV